MRGAIAALLLAAFCGGALAQSAPFLRAIARHETSPAAGLVSYTLQCPPAHVPIGYSLIRQSVYDDNTELSRDLVDRTNAVINRNGSLSATRIDGAGYSVVLQNSDHHQHELEALVTCLSPAATADNALMLVSATATATPRSVVTATSFCNADFPVALGGFSNAASRIQEEVGSSPVWGSSARPILLADVADGQTTPPTGWQVKLFNNSSNASQVTAFAVCGKAPSLQAFVYSVSVPLAAFGAATPFSIFAPVPDGWSAVGMGFDGGAYGQYVAFDAWTGDGAVIGALQWYPSTTTYDSASAEIRAFIARANGVAPGGVAARAVVAVMALPKPSSSPSTVNVVEFYNAGLDHYFITSIANEIEDLDAGVHPGWTRTGFTFNAYAIGSGGRTGRRPVCRIYGRPEVGLNSHFYSASPDECVASLVNTLGAWAMESSEVFQIDLPDSTTGACPANGIPVYRVWNARADSNHRYTTSLAIRDEMTRKGGVAEGYGADAVALCALP